MTPLLLDTHIWIWLMNGEPRIEHSKQLKIIEKAADESQVKISMISIWEIAMLEAKHRIELDLPIKDWVRHALSVSGISLSPMTEEILIESTRLPGSFHGDPADRIIAATARYLNATLVTNDSQILRYAKQKHVKVLEV